MAKLPRISGKKLIKALKKDGFEVLRIKGSHHFLAHPDGRRTVIPVHRNEIIGPGLLSKILRDCEMEPSKFSKLLDR
ncbi:MAG: type II toxin-antitoxin system HicA family toxin [Anaerolineae bacterium]|nr:type II toxin-antitoxin system HicA family toxin [Anaerolineae bacterium]